jgi:hypothetical protein
MKGPATIARTTTPSVPDLSGMMPGGCGRRWSEGHYGRKSRREMTLVARVSYFNSFAILDLVQGLSPCRN